MDLKGCCFFSLYRISQSSRVFTTLWGGNLLNLCSPVQRGVISPIISPVRASALLGVGTGGRQDLSRSRSALGTQIQPSRPCYDNLGLSFAARPHACLRNVATCLCLRCATCVSKTCSPRWRKRYRAGVGALARLGFPWSSAQLCH